MSRQIDLSRIMLHGSDLKRPECVVTHSSGKTFVPDWSENGGVAIIDSDGSVKKILSKGDFIVRPNGIALEQGGSFLLAHLGDRSGGVYRLYPNGDLQPVLTHVNGEPLPPTNFVMLDRQNRMWVTVSTRKQPRSEAYRSNVSDGFIVLVDGSESSIVVDNLGYTNECLISKDGDTLFVNETFGRKLSAFELDRHGVPGPKRVITEFSGGVYPDGLCQDETGDLWVTSIVSNRVIRVSPNGQTEIVIDDSNAEHVNSAEIAYKTGTMGRPHLDHIESARLRNLSSMAFGGESLTTGYFGCLLGQTIYKAEMGVRGVPPVHWLYDIGPL